MGRLVASSIPGFSWLSVEVSLTAPDKLAVALRGWPCHLCVNVSKNG